MDDGEGDVDGVAAEEDEVEEEREIEDLELEMKAMAQRIIDSRRTIPDRLSHVLSSHLIALRPPLSADPVSDVHGQSQWSEDAPLEGDDQEMLQKLQAFSAKTFKNIAEMPVILRRMKDCILRMDKLDEGNVETIHSVFKQK